MNRLSMEQCLENDFSACSRLAQELPEQGFFGALFKRLFDIVFSLAVIVLLLPIFLTIAFLVRKTSYGPAIFSQKRVGRDGKIFTMYKFRSMWKNVNHYDFSPVKDLDHRITPFGIFLRNTCLDELPQFFNVLKGDMSVVGPRPEMEFIVEKYNSVERKRLSVKPGITGLWQVMANRKKLIHENIDWDLRYIEKMSFILDLEIIVRTIWLSLKGVAK